jgi:hypothetical protein
MFALSSVIVGDLDFVGVAFMPPEAGSPLIVYSYAVLTLAAAFQRFKAITRNVGQVSQRNRSIQLSQFPPCHTLN